MLSEITLLRGQITALSDVLAKRQFTPYEPPSPSARPAHLSSLPSPDLYTTFLGPFTLYREKTRLSLGLSKSVLELCRYLIAHAGQMVPRDELIELLWPDVDPDRAVHRLHVAVSTLRRALNGPEPGEGCLQLGDNSYSIAAQAVLTDCDLFEYHYGRGKLSLTENDHAGAAAAFRAALTLYRGDYLADHPYAQWTHQYRAHFIERRLNALTFLCERALLENNLFAVVEYAQEILAIDNLRERTHRLLMRAHYNLGQRACAIRHYNICADYLRQELGEIPSQETQRLFHAIRNDAALPSETPLRL